MFKGILIENDENGYRANLRNIEESCLPEGDVTIRVQYSTLNYKDGLAITGKGPVINRFPMIPGIDLVGTVEESDHSHYLPGNKVILNGWGIGENRWGGLAEKVRVKGDWLLPLPAAFTPLQAMAIGTAGYTAMLCCMAIERHGVTPDHGEILVTGASGGVGSLAIAILSKLGFQVVGVTGRPEEERYLKQLGAKEVISRTAFSSHEKPLGKARWAAAVDVAGGRILANICATTKYGGVVTACGLVGGMDFPATVAPFILRGISLVGIDSVMCPMPLRLKAWQRLEMDLDLSKLEILTHEIGLSEAINYASLLLVGKLQGRVVVDINR